MLRALSHYALAFLRGCIGQHLVLNEVHVRFKLHWRLNWADTGREGPITRQALCHIELFREVFKHGLKVDSTAVGYSLLLAFLGIYTLLFALVVLYMHQATPSKSIVQRYSLLPLS